MDTTALLLNEAQRYNVENNYRKTQDSFGDMQQITAEKHCENGYVFGI